MTLRRRARAEVIRCSRASRTTPGSRSVRRSSSDACNRAPRLVDASCRRIGRNIPLAFDNSASRRAGLALRLILDVELFEIKRDGFGEAVLTVGATGAVVHYQHICHDDDVVLERRLARLSDRECRRWIVGAGAT